MKTIKTKLNTKTFLIISIISYFIIFYKLLSPSITMFSGKDSINYHYPTAFYLYERLHNGVFPSYTERILGGYPIYADIEVGYLNPTILVTTYLFNPIGAYKLIHFLTYLLGSYGLFRLIQKKGGSFLGYIAANTVYLFSFFALYHQQHFNITRVFYLLPLLISVVGVFIGAIYLLREKNEKFL